MADRRTPEQIKAAVLEFLNQFVVGSEGGNISGSLTITGDGNFVKAPDLYIGTSSVKELIEAAAVSPSVSIEIVMTDADSTPSVEVTGTDKAPIFTLKIPKSVPDTIDLGGLS